MSSPPDSERDELLSRRQFLGVSGLGVGLGAVAFATNTLPAPVVDARTKRREIPAISPQIEIPSAHVEAATEHAQQVTEDAERAWSRADPSSLDKMDRAVLEEGTEKARNALEDVSTDSGTPKTLEEIQYATSVAAETLGAARYLNDEYSVANRQAEQSEIQSKIGSLRNRIEIECDDSHEFLVHVGRVEYHLQQASGFARRVSAPEDAMEAGEMLSNLESVFRDEEDGRRIYRRYRERQTDPKSFERELTRNRKRLEDAAESLLDQYEEDSGGELPDNAYRQVRSRIHTHGWFYGRSRLWEAQRYRDEGLDVLAAITTAEAHQHLLAWRDAKNRIGVPEDADRVDAKRVFRAKRDAVDELRNAIDDAEDGPYARKLLETARDRIDSGDSALDFSDYPRAEAYGRYLLGRTHAENANDTANELARW
ncbi:hypothetical protein [Halorussus litoreus]|uniref:hypothetical protein n=1 Tax=Halorussus litoreus TaxID=1710536 RepID=UPI001E620582|nr:hypothetical protein [Halorussus litoreus]